MAGTATMRGPQLAKQAGLANSQHKTSNAPPHNKMDTLFGNYRQELAASEKSARSSFSSVREHDSDLAQTFTSTKESSYSRAAEEAIEDSTPAPAREMTTTMTQFIPPVTRPQSRLHGTWFPAVAADGFEGWKQIDVKGRKASRSFGDLQALRVVWSTPATPKVKRPGRLDPGQSFLERLPLELLGPIIDLLVIDIPPNGIAARNVDLMSLLLTSRTLHTATLYALYKNITIPHSRIFRKFLAHITTNQELGTIVRRLDFSHFNPTSFFMTASERATTRNLTPETLLQSLELMPHLRELLAQEYVDEEISEPVLRKIFFGLPRLEAVDFCGCSSSEFKGAFTSLLSAQWPEMLSITRLSLHRCINLPSKLFETILPRLTHLNRLDVAGTRITDEALHSIPHTARITHLNLANCKLLTAQGVIDFFQKHPAVQNSLVYLSLASDARSHQLLDADDLTALIPALPTSLVSLSLKGSNMDASHIDLLRPLSKNLEELALGGHLAVKDIDRLFHPDEPDEDEEVMEIDWVPHSLKFLDLSDYSFAEINLGTLFSRDIAMMKKFSAPLEVIEVSEDAFSRFKPKTNVLEHEGWTITDFGNRAWLVRRPSPDDGPRDSGARGWKLGATFWGMRKIPMAVAEVGGMYGSYMFKRKL